MGGHARPNWDTQSSMNAVLLPDPGVMLGMTPTRLRPRDSPTPART